MAADEWGKLLVKHGFIKKDARPKYRKNDIKGIYEPIGEGGMINPSDAEMEEEEEVNIQAVNEPAFAAYYKTGYPTPFKRYRLISEGFNLSIEETYYWLLNYIRQDSSFHHVDKITDIFTASEQSAFWGAAQSRVGIQQERASQYLKGISEMVKQVFQLVRELRII